MLQDVGAVAAMVSAIGILLAGLTAWLTYCRAQRIERVANGNRMASNRLVAKVAYIQGMQDAIIKYLLGDQQALRDALEFPRPNGGEE